MFGLSSGVHADIIHTLKNITAHHLGAVVVSNGNGVILHEYGLDSYVQIQHYWDDHGKDSDIK